MKVKYHDSNFKHSYIDVYTGDVLDLTRIRAAVMEELNCLNDKHVWQLEDIRKVRKTADAVHVRTRWVLCNKGDEANPDVELDWWPVKSTRPAKRTLSLRRPRLVDQKRCVFNVRQQAQHNFVRYIDCAFAPQLRRHQEGVFKWCACS